MSDKLRRSERLKSQDKLNEDDESKPTTSQEKENTKTVVIQDDKRSITSHKSRHSSMNSVNRQKLAIRLEYAKKKKQHEQEILDLEMALKIAEIDEEQSIIDDPNIQVPTLTDKAKVEAWIDRQEQEMHASESTPNINKLLSRQSLPKELPNFSGNPTEWPNFICQYRNSTEICGFTDEENQYRLQKCLKGKAKEIVNSLLILPKNVNKVICILERRFGRPECIISMLLEQVKKITALKEEKLDQLIDFSDAVNNLVYTLKLLNENDHIRNPLLVQELVDKMPMSYKIRWIKQTKFFKPNDAKLEKFQEWLSEQADVACQLQNSHLSNFEDKHNLSKIKEKNVFVTTKNENTLSCCCCSLQKHHLSKCQKFLSLSIDDRWTLMTTKRICFSCLNPGHGVTNCLRKESCGINGCKRPHNKLLHKEYKNMSSTSQQANCQTNCHISQKSNETLLKILPVKIYGKTKTIDTFALLDDASTVTLIDHKIAEELEIDGPEKPLNLQWPKRNLTQNLDSKIVNFSISGCKSKQFFIRNARTMEDMSLPTQVIDVNELVNKYPYMNCTHIPRTKFVGKPTVLIGQDNWPLLTTHKTKYGPWKGPALSKTPLGWVIHGNNGNYKSDQNYIYHINKEKDDLDILHDLIKEQWKIDNIGIKELTNTSQSKQDKRAQNILDKTMTRIGNKFETGLLWKEDEVVFPESKKMAMSRLHCTEKKMDKDKTYAEAYCNKIKEMEEKGYVRKLTPKEAEVETSKTWYLPHFGVINPNKPNKIRVVFDAASKSNGICLNDKLLTGPDLYNSLYNILLNFRIKKIAFVADIKEMFLQVMVRKEDRCAQRFLWHGMERHVEPDIYEIQVVFFGSTSGPCLAQEAKNKNAQHFQDKYPAAANAIIKHHYMDDYLGNADNEDEAIKLINEVINIHKQGGFILCNWISNSQHVLKNIDPSLTKFGQDFDIININNDLTTERILGLWWNSLEDNFSYHTKFHKIDKDVLNGNRRPTKREILKVIMSIFDPLGFLANFIIQGKILLQEIWRSGLGWDDEITDLLNMKWKNWLADLKNIYKFKIPRQYSNLKLNDCKIELHIFCDASEDAYAAVAYFRIINDSNISTSFICARTRVSPLKATSIPRLELQAALMGARLGNSLKNELNLNIEKTTYWSDSNTVLHWIKSETRRFKTFVAQRVGEIQELTNTEDWNYVRSKDNVADQATERIKEFDFTNNSTWINGPKFMLEEKIFIEAPEEVQVEALELKNEFVLVIRIISYLPTPEPDRFSKWNKLLSTAWIIRFIRKCQKRYIPNENSSELQIEELKFDENLLLKQSQKESFATEMSVLNNKEKLSKSSRLFTLSCSLDENGIIRMNGRLNNATILNESTRKPIILDPKHKIVKLLLKQYHENANHLGREMIINEIRQKYWILSVRQAVRRTWFECQKCQNEKIKPKIPIMGQLPQCRLEPTIRPFIKTGVDYFGPIEVTVKRSHEKRYGVIFTCMVTRAVHLEIAPDLSTNGFIHAYRQFGCRRGFPEELYSDNGTNFKGADKELKDAIENLNQDEITKYLTFKNTKWYFNPPSAPHMGGIWERLIQIIKKNLTELLKDRYPHEYVLRTVFCEIENLINSRPLTYVSVDSEDPEALTPNHFLIGPSYAASSCASTNENDLYLLSKWRAAQRLTDIFWKRWVREYLPTLISRNKWRQQQRQVKIGDIVVIADADGPRNTWPMGKIISLYPGKDGIVRVVDVKTTTGTYRRSVTKICVLPIKENLE